MSDSITALSAVSVDVITLRYDVVAKKVLVGLVERGWDPFKGHLALPGVLLGPGERLAEAGRRALGKMGLDGDVSMGQCRTFDEPSRDPRGPTLSIAMWATVRPDASGGESLAHWVPLAEIPALAFDHNQIITTCQPLLAQMAWRSTAFSRPLTGETFTGTDALAISTSLEGRPAHRGGVNRLLETNPDLARAQVTTASTGGRPPVGWQWAPA